MQISNETIEQIRTQNDIYDVVSQYVKLEKRGRNYIGLCPFHDEKTPSFTVSVDKQICHCFGCKKGGNVFSFIQEIEGISFIEAVKLLGEQVNIPVQINQPVAKNESDDHAVMIEMHEKLKDAYHYILRAVEDAEPALNYLYERGFTDEMINREKIGFAPNVSQYALQFLKENNFDVQLAYEAGLLSRNDEDFSYYDRFRNRIMFPIENAQGKTIGFSGRTYDGSEPKYLNSPESPIFQKRQTLYHVNHARKYIRQSDELILLEGFMDVLKLNKIGIQNALATMGTALSREHTLHLKKLANNVTLMFDGDFAGQEAAEKIGQILLKERLNVFVVPMKAKMDPDEMIESLGETAFKEYIAFNKQHYLSYYLKKYKKEIENNDLAYEKHLQKFLDDVKLMNSAHLQKKVLHEASELFKVDFDVLNFQNTRQPKQKNQMPTFQHEHLSKLDRAERVVLKYFMNDKHLFQTFKSIVDVSYFKNKMHQMIYEALIGYYNQEEEYQISRFINHIPIELHEIIMKLDVLEVNQSPSNEEVNDYLNVLNRDLNLQSQLESLKHELNQAIRIGDIDARNELTRKIMHIQKQRKARNIQEGS